MADTHTGVQQGSNLFIVDNSVDESTVHGYLHDWCQFSHRFDIATGNFEIGSLLGLDGEWQKVDKLRILMGGDVSFRTKQAFQKALEPISAAFEQEMVVDLPDGAGDLDILFEDELPEADRLLALGDITAARVLYDNVARVDPLNRPNAGANPGRIVG